jgi:hypothetical protein
MEGIRRFPVKSTILKTLSFNNYEYVVRGRQKAACFEIDTRIRQQEGEWKTKKFCLMSPSTGAIDLRVYTMAIKPLLVMSVDQHTMKVDATLEFQLDKNRLFRCFQYGNLGVSLISRFEGAIISEISSRENQEIIQDISKIEQLIFEEMIALEEEDSSQLEDWRSEHPDKYVNTYFKTKPSRALGIRITNVAVHVEQDDTLSDTPLVKGGEAAQGSVMSILPKHLDTVRDLFLRARAKKFLRAHENKSDDTGKEGESGTTQIASFRDDYEAANEALLRMLEMHTRENIARNAAKSGQMVVISSEELGLARTSIFRSGLRVPEGKSTSEPKKGPEN